MDIPHVQCPQESEWHQSERRSEIGALDPCVERSPGNGDLMCKWGENSTGLSWSLNGYSWVTRSHSPWQLLPDHKNQLLKWDPSGPSDHPFRWDPTSSIWMACFPPSSYWDTQKLWKSPKISCCFWKILRHPTRLTARLTGTHVVRRSWKGGGWCDQRHRREPAEIRTEALPRWFRGEFLWMMLNDAEWCWILDWWKPDFFFIQHDKFKGRFGNQKKIKRIWISASKSLLC